jgi:hypothetical protein
MLCLLFWPERAKKEETGKRASRDDPCGSTRAALHLIIVFLVKSPPCLVIRPLTRRKAMSNAKNQSRTAFSQTCESRNTGSKGGNKNHPWSFGGAILRPRGRKTRHPSLTPRGLLLIRYRIAKKRKWSPQLTQIYPPDVMTVRTAISEILQKRPRYCLNDNLPRGLSDPVCRVLILLPLLEFFV